jgi:hypothetical protein
LNVSGESSIVFELLQDLAIRPQPFASYTAQQLWTHPHVSAQMLKAHLEPDSDRASRRHSEIDASGLRVHLRVNPLEKTVGRLG